MYQTPGFICSFRALLALLVFFGLAVLYMQRTNMGIAILCMVNHTSIESDQLIRSSISSKADKCYLEQKNSTLTDGPFLWPKKTQGIILSTFFYGYFISQIPGGWLSIKIGGVRTFGFSILFGSITTILIPLAARNHFYLLLVVRFLTGLFHGPCFPSLGTLWSHWAPPNERSRILGIATSGVQIGNIVALPLGGYLCRHGFDNGWPSIFYIYGLIGVVWATFFIFFISESPANQKFISNQESFYIIQNIKKPQQKPKRTPWKPLFTAKSSLAIYVVTFCFNWGAYLYMTQIPTYIRDVLKFDIESNGIISSIPFVVSWIVVIKSSFIADYLISKNKLRKISVRKLYTSLSMFTPMVALIFLSYIDCSSPYLGIFFLVLGQAFNGCAGTGGFFINSHEIAGPFSGILIGIQNMIGTIPGFIGPYIVGLLTSNQKMEEWRIVFWITSFLYCIGCIFYLVFTRVDIQPWAIIGDSDNQKIQADLTINVNLNDTKLTNKK